LAFAVASRLQEADLERSVLSSQKSLFVIISSAWLTMFCQKPTPAMMDQTNHIKKMCLVVEADSKISVPTDLRRLFCTTDNHVRDSRST
jgi:hypothetical protein